MKFSAAQLCEHLGDLVLSKRNIDVNFESIDSPDSFVSTSLVFIPEQVSLDNLGALRPAGLVTTANIATQLKNDPACVIVVSNVRLAMALAKQKFADYDHSDSEWGDVHPSALIHPTAQLGDGVRIGPNSVIGKDVEIANNVQIRANCVIEHGAFIGADSVIHSMVNIGYNCILGERVIIRPGVVIGNEGFGFAQDDNKHYERIPHTGIVEISDDVQIGSNSNIDRATFGVTRIERGVKIDALCHVGHNVHVDEDVLLVAQCGVAGSSSIGKRAILSGQTGVLDHRTIVDDAVLVHRCGVTTDILEPGMWAGTPPKPFKEYVRDLNLPKKVAKLEKAKT